MFCDISLLSGSGYIYIYDRGNGSPGLRLVGEAPVRTRIGHHLRDCVSICAGITEL
jgi:hypothetical protein